MIAVLKKILSVLMVILMVLTAVPLSSFVGVELPAFDWGVKASATNELAATGQCGDNVYWNYDATTGELVISGSGDMWDYEWNTSPFYCASYIESLTIENGITRIGNHVFYDCNDLTGDLIIPKSVENIGYLAFAFCEGFTGSLSLPDSLTSISYGAFFGCSGFTGDLIIPDSLTTIGDSIFSGCDGFDGRLVISDSVTVIESSAFAGCSGFTGDLIIPNSVVEIGGKAFDLCSGFNGILQLPENLTTISYCAFQGCSGIMGIAIPRSVTTIDLYAFLDCNPQYICYEGSNSDWGKIAIAEENDRLLNAYFHYVADNTFSNYVSDGNATCQTAGTKTAYCDVCGAKDTIEIEGSLLDHYMYEAECIKSTCTQEGKIIYNCKNCDYSDEKTLPLEKHNYYKAETIESTCVQEGTVVYKCKDCTDSYEEKLPLGKHDMYEADCIKSTCTQEGKIIYNCKNCDYSEEYKLSLEKHNYYEAEYIEPTCTKEGKYVYKCTNCTDSYEKVVSPCHIYYEAEYIEQTCTKEGKIVYKCKYCSESYEKILSACHIYYEYERIESTCTKEGKIVYKCKYCSESYEVISKAGHTFVDPEYVAPTCTVDGKRSGTCKTCGIYVTETVPAIGHSFTLLSQTIADCITGQSGIRKDVCIDCGYIRTSVVDAQHSFGMWKIVKVATCTTEGKKERSCMVAGCGATEELIIAKLGHTFSDWVVDGDIATRTCKTCNFTETSSDVKLTGQCGDDVYWTFNVITGELTIYGTGPTWDYGDYWGVYSPFVYLNIKSAVIENGVTTIGANLFYGAQELKSISLPDSVIEFGDAAFYECKVENINIPSNLKSIGAEAFYGASMSGIVIPKSVEYIGDAAFCKCANLKAITVDNNNRNYSNDEYGVLFNKDRTVLIQYPLGRTANTYSIPDGVITVKFCAFYTPIHLENIGIPDSLVVVEDLGLACRSVKCVCYRGTQAQWEEIFYNSYNPLQEANFHCVKENNFSNYTNDNNATCTTDETKTAYCGVCGAKDTVKIENTALGHTFSYWVVDGDIATRTCKTCNFTETSSDVKLTGQCGDDVYWTFNVITGELVISGSGAMWDYYEVPVPWNNWSNQINSLIIKEGITETGSCIFKNCVNLQTILLPKTLTYIDEYSFTDCKSLKIVDFPESIIISESAFQNCDSLTEVTIPVGATIIQWAFDGCDNLKTVIFESDIKYYGDAFSGCPSLEIVYYNDPDIVIIEQNTFNGTALKDVYYNGYIRQWKLIEIEEGNDPLLNATIHCLDGDYPDDYEEEDEYVDEYFTYDSIKLDETKVLEVNKNETHLLKFTPNETAVYIFVSESSNNETLAAICSADLNYIAGECGNNDFRLVYELKAGETYYWAVQNIDDYAEGSLNVTLTKGKHCEFEERHSYTNYIYNNDATEYLNGTKTAYCDYGCGAKDTVEIENTALGHDYYVKERIEATCTLEGKVVFECKRCKVTYEEAADKLEHKWNEVYKIVTQPTCTQEGIEAIVCTVCDSAKEGSKRSIEKLPHKFTDWSTEGNKSTRYCEVCNYTETKINTDGGDIEIEAPEQSDDADFVVDEIVTGGKDYVVIEEAVSNGTDNSWEVIKAFDINLKNHDGVHVQPNGTVKVKLPHDWSKDGNYKVYRVNDDGTLTDMNAYRQGSHLVFDTDHFSIYVVVGEAEKTDTPDEPEAPENPSDNCSCKCHKTGFFTKLIWKITIFFNRLFKKNQVCSCGVNHY